MSGYRTKIATMVSDMLVVNGVDKDTACFIFDRLVDGMISDKDYELEEIYAELSAGEK